MTVDAGAKRTKEGYEGRMANFMDVDRMVNEGLGGGVVSKHNGLIDDSTTDEMSCRESVYDDGAL